MYASQVRIVKCRFHVDTTKKIKRKIPISIHSFVFQMCSFRAHLKSHYLYLIKMAVASQGFTRMCFTFCCTN